MTTKRKSISDAGRCREALPMLDEAKVLTAEAWMSSQRFHIGHAMVYVDSAIQQLKLARKSLTQ